MGKNTEVDGRREEGNGRRDVLGESGREQTYSTPGEGARLVGVLVAVHVDDVGRGERCVVKLEEEICRGWVSSRDSTLEGECERVVREGKRGGKTAGNRCDK